MSEYYSYSGYEIREKRDMPPGLGRGWVVVDDNGCNAIPGAGYAGSVGDAHMMIDCLILSGGDAAKYHAAVELYLRAAGRRD